MFLLRHGMIGDFIRGVGIIKVMGFLNDFERFDDMFGGYVSLTSLWNIDGKFVLYMQKAYTFVGIIFSGFLWKNR